MKTPARQGAKILSLLIPLSCLLMVLPAALPAAEPPDWVTRGVEAVYPQSEYIAVEGRGKNKKEAELDALSVLSQYFETRIESSVLDYEKTISEGKTETYQGVFDAKTTAQSAAKVFAVRYAPPYFDKTRKMYITAAFIERAEAWRIFVPKIRREADAFRALLKNAEGETESIKQFLAYKAALNWSVREDFLSALCFGEAVSPSNMKEFADVQKNYAALPAKLQTARNSAQVYIDCGKDFESVIQNTLGKMISAEGLIVTKNRKNAQAVCAVTINEGFTKREDINLYYPKIDIVLNGKNGAALFSYAYSADKQAAALADVAKRRAYTALAAGLQNNFAAEFNKVFRK